MKNSRQLPEGGGRGTGSTNVVTTKFSDGGYEGLERLVTWGVEMLGTSWAKETRFGDKGRVRWLNNVAALGQLNNRETQVCERRAEQRAESGEWRAEFFRFVG